MYFILKTGTHVSNGKLFSAGEIVESKILLDEVFGAEKFEKTDRVRRRRNTEEKSEETKEPEGDNVPEGDIETDGTKEPEGKPLYVLLRKNVWYDVLNDETGEKVNDKSLRKEEAEKLLESLNA